MNVAINIILIILSILVTSFLSVKSEKVSERIIWIVFLVVSIFLVIFQNLNDFYDKRDLNQQIEILNLKNEVQKYTNEKHQKAIKELNKTSWKLDENGDLMP